MNLEVQIEPRRCANCQRPFRVLVTSKQMFCCEECGSGMQGRGAPQRQLKGNGKGKESISVSVTAPTKPIESYEDFATKIAAWPKRNKTSGRTEKVINDTRRSEMQPAENGQIKTESAKTRISARTITSEEQNGLKPFTAEEMSQTQPELSEGQLSPIEVASVDMLSLSKRSGERLMRLMESAVTDNDFERQKDGGGGVPLHNIETAIGCANALANLMQVNVNLLKAIKSK